MQEIFQSIKKIALKINEALKYEDTNYTNETNSTGDTQLALDVKSDMIIEEELKKLSSIQKIISEEKEEALHVNQNGRYIVGYDPLDGSSLVDVNLSVGSIFGIYENDICGENLKAACYVVYGPRVELVIAQEKVELFRLDKNSNFVKIKDIELQEKGKLNASGGTQKYWAPFHKKMIDEIFEDGYRLRYSGGMVPDLHQILLKGGGLFSYPATNDNPKGKLRMVFEVFPYAFIFEKARGEAIDGKERLLELKPTHVHDTTPCFFGSRKEIQRVRTVYERN